MTRADVVDYANFRLAMGPRINANDMRMIRSYLEHRGKTDFNDTDLEVSIKMNPLKAHDSINYMVDWLVGEFEVSEVKNEINQTIKYV